MCWGVRDSRSPPFPPALASWRPGSPSFGSPVDRARECTDSPLLYARLQPTAQNAVEPVDRTSASIPGSRAWFEVGVDPCLSVLTQLMKLVRGGDPGETGDQTICKIAGADSRYRGWGYGGPRSRHDGEREPPRLLHAVFSSASSVPAIALGARLAGKPPTLIRPDPG
jgi:hypothetical protein